MDVYIMGVFGVMSVFSWFVVCFPFSVFVSVDGSGGGMRSNRKFMTRAGIAVDGGTQDSRFQDSSLSE